LKLLLTLSLRVKIGRVQLHVWREFSDELLLGGYSNRDRFDSHNEGRRLLLLQFARERSHAAVSANQSRSFASVFHVASPGDPMQITYCLSFLLVHASQIKMFVAVIFLVAQNWVAWSHTLG